MASKKTYKTKTRRANNEGSIFQRKDGLWAGSITLGYNDDGKIKRKVVYGKTRLEVANKVAEITNRISNDNYADALKNNNYKLAFLYAPSKWSNRDQNDYKITRIPIYKSNSLLKFIIKVIIKI